MKFTGQTQTGLLTPFCSDWKKEHLVETPSGSASTAEHIFAPAVGIAKGSPLYLAPSSRELLSECEP